MSDRASTLDPVATPAAGTTNPSADLGLLLVRLALGGVMIAHGAQKLLGGVAGTQQGFDQMGIPLADVAGVGVIALELGGGVLVVLGVLTRLVAGLFAASMVVASLLVHLPNGFFAGAGGWELTGLLAVLGLALVVAGSGRYGLDRLVRRRRG